MANLTLGQVCQNRMAFLWKNALIGQRSISLQSVCAKITLSRTITVERRSVQKLHSSAIALLQIFKLFFAGSRVSTVFVTSHTYRIYLGLLVYPKLCRHLKQLARLQTSPACFFLRGWKPYFSASLQCSLDGQVCFPWLLWRAHSLYMYLSGSPRPHGGWH